MDKKETLFKKLEITLGYKFKNLNLLKESIVHKSYANEKVDLKLSHNERLEFLGDAVLELAITDLLVKRFPDFMEGDLSRLRASIVNEAQLARLAVKLDLGKVILLGRGEELTEGRTKNSILANTYEAILAALYLDGGYNAAFQVAEIHFRLILEEATRTDFDRDFKTKLQEVAQAKYQKIPRYHVTKTSGPDHKKTFEVKVVVNSVPLAFGTGKSKKEAEQDAARNALQVLREEEKL